MTSGDDALLAAMNTNPQIVLHIAQAAGRINRRSSESDQLQQVKSVERDLYRLAGIDPGQQQPAGVGVVRNYRSKPGVPVKWSLPGATGDAS
jgi:hypothetical protein